MMLVLVMGDHHSARRLALGVLELDGGVMDFLCPNTSLMRCRIALLDDGGMSSMSTWQLRACALDPRLHT